MAGKGSAPGERRGGRRAGIPNKATIAREAEEAAALHAKGMKLGKEIMSIAANYFYGVAVKYLNGQDERAGLENLKIAASIAADVAPYESPRRQSIVFREEPLDYSKLSDDELATAIALAERATVSGEASGGAAKTRH